MLTYISVRNFAIIENIEVTFQPGMTALTGETGAGKSLLIDAIGLLLGDRATTNIVRTGADVAVVEGVFRIVHPEVKDALLQLEIPIEDDEVLVRRQISSTNTNVIKLNNKTVTLRDLRDVTAKLADIHTQEDTHRLIQQDTYLDIIDGFEAKRTTRLKLAYHEARDAYKTALQEWRRLQSQSDNLIEQLDLLRFQKQELEAHELRDGEEAELEAAIERMENFDAIYQTLATAKAKLDEHDALGTIFDAAKDLGSITSIGATYHTLKERFESNYYELYDVYETLQQELSSLDYDPMQLDQDIERLNRLTALKRKYRKTIPELIAHLEQITFDIENIDHYDDVLEDQRQVVEAAYEAALATGRELTTLRQETASYIETELLDILKDLELPQTQFCVHFEERKDTGALDGSLLLDTGIDEVDFLITTNVGEPLKPLSRSASGGEMSRIMLGFKNLLARSLHVSLMIFDEIDTGVSGYVAFQVAKKMKEIARTCQVICITHIPQVAAISEHHLLITKDVQDGRTRAHVQAVAGEDRIREIAGMISGDAITAASLASARELLHK